MSLKSDRYYEKHKEKILDKLRIKHQELKQEFITEYGGRCQCCGETNSSFLTLDHVAGNGEGRRHRDGCGNSTRIKKELKKQGWPKDGRYQILCYNCNCARAHNQNICPHQLNLQNN